MSWALAFAVAGVLQAAPSSTPSWWVDPASCPQWSTPLSREIALACEATGRACEVTTSDKAARRLALQCADTEHWTLEAHDVGGTGLWHIEVRGDSDERIRAAAIWVARSDVTMRPAPNAPAPQAPPAADPAPPAAAPPGRWGGLALAAHAAYYPDAGAGAPGFGGTLRVHDSGEIVRFLPSPFTSYAALTGEATSSGGYFDERAFSLRTGVGVIWHAPRTKDIIGFSLEMGAGLTRIVQTVPGSYTGDGRNPSTVDLTHTQHHPFGYAIAGVIAELPVKGDFRPFIALRLGTTVPKSPGFAMGGIEIGFRWIAW